MRTTLDIDSDVLHAVKEIARREKRTAGSVISNLAREGLKRDIHGDDAGAGSYLGFEPIAPGGQLVTTELVQQLIDEDDL